MSAAPREASPGADLEPGADLPPGVSGCPPPSAAGPLAPYGTRVLLRPQARPLEIVPFLKALLERLAESAVVEGATLIGHLKCVLHTGAAGDRPALGNLTSVRSGAAVRSGDADTIARGCEAQLDLAVLVYGLPVEAVDRLVGEVLEGLLPPAEVRWSKSTPAHSTHA